VCRKILKSLKVYRDKKRVENQCQRSYSLYKNQPWQEKEVPEWKTPSRWKVAKYTIWRVFHFSHTEEQLLWDASICQCVYGLSDASTTFKGATGTLYHSSQSCDDLFNLRLGQWKSGAILSFISERKRPLNRLEVMAYCRFWRSLIFMRRFFCHFLSAWLQWNLDNSKLKGPKKDFELSKNSNYVYSLKKKWRKRFKSDQRFNT